MRGSPASACPSTVREVQQLVADVRRTTQEVQGTVAELRGLIAKGSPDLEAAFANIRQISDNLAKTTTRLNSFVAENEPGVFALHPAEPAGIRATAAREPPGSA